MSKRLSILLFILLFVSVITLGSLGMGKLAWFILALFTFIDCIMFEKKQKALWIVIIILLPYLGSVAYIWFRRLKREKPPE